MAFNRIAELRELYFQQAVEPSKPTLPRLLILSYCITNFSVQSLGIQQGKRRQERLLNPLFIWIFMCQELR
jgi:hypothetical protein